LPETSRALLLKLSRLPLPEVNAHGLVYQSFSSVQAKQLRVEKVLHCWEQARAVTYQDENLKK
jgi:hypothetical protein